MLFCKVYVCVYVSIKIRVDFCPLKPLKYTGEAHLKKTEDRIYSFDFM